MMCCITFLQLTDPLHQGVQRALRLQPVSGRGVGQHALLLLQVADFLQELLLQLPEPALQQVAELAGERGAGCIGPHLMLLRGGWTGSAWRWSGTMTAASEGGYIIALQVAIHLNVISKCGFRNGNTGS